MKVDKKKIVTWAQDHGKGGWYIQETCKRVVGKRWDDAERQILCPTPKMEDAYIFKNKVVTNTYPKKPKGGPNCFDHIISSKSIMPRKIRVADKATRKLSDQAGLVAEW